MKIVGKIIDSKKEDELKGDMILVVSVDKDTDSYDGKINANDEKIDGLDFLTLAKAVFEQSYQHAINSGINPIIAKQIMKGFIDQI